MDKMPISILDSRNGSIGIGLIAIRIAEAVKEGKSLEEILIIAKQAINNTSLFLGLKTLEYGVRGGRIPKTVKKIADLLNINPILSFTPNGIKSVGKTFGRKNIIKKFKLYVEKSTNWEQPLRIGISHANCEDIALEYKEKFSKKVGKKNVFMSEIGPALGAHSGPGGLVIATQIQGDSLND